MIPDPQDPSYIVALNLISRSPTWLTALHAQPMYLGLDLRGGVHFMLQVDMQAALTKKAESYAGDLRSTLRDKNIRHGGISRDGPDRGHQGARRSHAHRGQQPDRRSVS